MIKNCVSYTIYENKEHNKFIRRNEYSYHGENIKTWHKVENL